MKESHSDALPFVLNTFLYKRSRAEEIVPGVLFINMEIVFGDIDIFNNMQTLHSVSFRDVIFLSRCP